MTYKEVTARLGFDAVCFNDPPCGLSDNAHRAGTAFLGIAHWSERRMNRRGLRRFLLLVAKRDRAADPGFLNTADLWWVHYYLDERQVNEWAYELGTRFPASYSGPERRMVALVPGLSRRQPAVYAWARRGTTL